MANDSLVLQAYESILPPVRREVEAKLALSPCVSRLGSDVDPGIDPYNGSLDRQPLPTIIPKQCMVVNEAGNRHTTALDNDQFRRLNTLIHSHVYVHPHPTLAHALPTLSVRLKDIVSRIRDELINHNIIVRDVRINGGAANHVLHCTDERARPNYNDLDLIYFVKLGSSKDMERIKHIVLETLFLIFLRSFNGSGAHGGKSCAKGKADTPLPITPPGSNASLNPSECDDDDEADEKGDGDSVVSYCKSSSGMSSLGTTDEPNNDSNSSDDLIPPTNTLRGGETDKQQQIPSDAAVLLNVAQPPSAPLYPNPIYSFGPPGLVNQDFLREAYIHKMVKVCAGGDLWSLLALNNNDGRNLELKFVSSMKRQFEFSVDSFQIILDPLLDSLQNNFFDDDDSSFDDCDVFLTPSHDGRDAKSIVATPDSDDPDNKLAPDKQDLLLQSDTQQYSPIKIVCESVYGNFDQALMHLKHKLIATIRPEEIRGGGLLKYCNLLIQGYTPADISTIKSLEKYMCSRFFIDFGDLRKQENKLDSYLKSHFIKDYHTLHNYLVTLYRVVDSSTVCLMGHERREILKLIENMFFSVHYQHYPLYHYHHGRLSSSPSLLATSGQHYVRNYYPLETNDRNLVNCINNATKPKNCLLIAHNTNTPTTSPTPSCSTTPTTSPPPPQRSI